MNKEFVYLIAEKLYLNTTDEPLCNRNWLFAIYKALLIANEGDTESIIWTIHKQWKIDHNCRASKTTAKANNTYITNFDLALDEENNATIKVKFNKKGTTTEIIECNYNSAAFTSELWEFKNPNNETVLLSAFERDQLFNASIQNAVQLTQPEVITSAVSADKPNEKANKQNKDEYIRDMKFTALNMLLDQVRDKYKQIEDQNQKSYLEVVIGAAIFYLPCLNSHFNGFISVNALKGYLNNERRVKDHIFPRKLAAKKLLENPLSLTDLKKQYHDHLAKYMYITSAENSILVNYYEQYEHHDLAMEAFQIEKFPTSNEAKFISHNELDRFILFLSGKNAQSKSKEELMGLLSVFRG